MPAARDEDVANVVLTHTPGKVRAVIRVLVVDDHPTIRAGVRVSLRGEPGLLAVGTAESVDTAVTAARSVSADVVLLDVHLPGGGGLLAARLLKGLPKPPRVLLFTAFADDALLVPALIAGADGILGKEAGGEALFEAIRRVHSHGRVLRQPSVEEIHAVMRRLEVDDQPIAAMLLDGASLPEVAATLRLDMPEAETRVGDMLAALQNREPTSLAQGSTRPRRMA